MSKRKLDDTGLEADKDSKKPKLFTLLYSAFNYALDGNEDEANEYWERATRRVKRCRKFRKGAKQIPEVEFKYDDIWLPLHLAIEHAAPYSLIKAIVRKYNDGCKVAFDGMSPLEIACTHPKKISRDVGFLRDDTEWENIITLLMKVHPGAIDFGKNTALHLVLEYNPSLKLVKRMIEYHTNKIDADAAVGKKKKKRRKKKKILLEMKDEQDQLPLHVATEHGRSKMLT